MRSMHIERLELDDISAIRAEISRAIPDGETSVLTLAFRGVYRDGSAGNPDARYMAAIATQAVYAWEPRAVVYDLRTLEYRWGDGILQLFEVDAEEPLIPLPCALVVGDGCRAGLASLIRAESMFDDLEPAVRHVCERYRELARLDEDNELSMVMYILVRDDVPLGHAMVAAAHASLAAYERFRRRWEMRTWLSGVFRKVVCRVSEREFEDAKSTTDHVVLTESALGGREVALAFCPRPAWPEAFQLFPLYR
jgi:hypothetical protein